MVVQISPDRPRRRFTGPQPTPDEALDAISGYAAYFGTYTVDERASCSYLKSARTCGRSGSLGSA